MPATTTLRQILIELAERYALGTVVALTSNTTTTLTLTTTGSPELRGPFTAAKIPIGSPVVITVETSGTSVLGNRTFVSNWVPSTGVVTVSPAIGDTDATEAIIWDSSIRDSDRVIEAINRALTNRVGRWELRPLTYVPDGDLQGATVTDYWTAAANGTAAYANAQVFPAGSAADAVGQVYLNRILQLTSSAGGSTSLDSNGIRVVPNTSTTGHQWYFLTAIRLVSGTGTAAIVVRDNTASANISVDVIRGSDSNTHETTSLGDFMLCEGVFNLPQSCAEIAFRLTLSAASMVMQMGPIIAFPLNAYAFPLPNRIETAEQIGNFFWGGARNGPAGFAHVSLSEPLTVGGYTHKIIDYGDHRSVSFNFTPTRAVWYEEYVSGSSLTAMTDTTTFPLDRICKWAVFELYDRLMRDEMHSKARAESGAPLPSIFRPLRNAAFKSADNSSYEPEIKNIRGRV